MARAQGARSQLAAAFETTYGTAPASGFMQMPFASASLGAEQPLLASELLGYGRDPLPPLKDAVTADGDITVPLDAEAFGFWLKAAFGAPTMSDTIRMYLRCRSAGPAGPCTARQAIAKQSAERGFGRASHRYQSRRDPAVELRMRLKELAESRVRYGYRRLHTLLQREGWQVNHKRLYRLYCEEGLSIRTRSPKRRRACRYRSGRSEADGMNDVWAMHCPIGDCASAICRKGLHVGPAVR
jgi:hypothetical protein